MCEVCEEHLSHMLTVLQLNLDYPDPDYPDYSIIRTFFSGSNFSMNIN